MFRSSPIPRRSALALGVAATLAAPLIAAGATQAAPVPFDAQIFCPPNIAKVGVPYAAPTGLYDDDHGSYAASIAGPLPEGLALVSRTGLAPVVKGTPSKLGGSTFTVTLTDQWAQTRQRECHIDVVPAASRIERIGAADRYEEATDIAYEINGAGIAPLVYIASGENYADALTASAIAAQHRAPILLSTRDAVPASAARFIRGKGPVEIVVVGSEDALSSAVVDQLASLSSASNVTRIGGSDRYETSRMLIENAKFGAAPTSALFVASGRVFPDALSASPAAATISAPVLLLDGAASALTAPEKTLLTKRSVKNVTVFGGTDTLSSGLENDLKAIAGSTSRIDGVDRYAVSGNTVAKYFPATPPSDTVYLATGATFPDALAGGALAGKNHAPILLVSKSCMSSEVAAQITRLNPQRLVLLGGWNTLDAALGTLPICG